MITGKSWTVSHLDLEFLDPGRIYTATLYSDDNGTIDIRRFIVDNRIQNSMNTFWKFESWNQNAQDGNAFYVALIRSRNLRKVIHVFKASFHQKEHQLKAKRFVFVSGNRNQTIVPSIPCRYLNYL